MLENQIIKHMLVGILIILGSALVGQIIKFLLNSVFKRLFEATKTTLDDRMLEVVRSKVMSLSIITGMYIGIREVRKSLLAEDLTYHQVLDDLSIVLFVLLVFVLTRLVGRLLATTIEWYMDEVSSKTHSNITATVAPMTGKIINIGLFLIAAMIVLDHFGINIGSFLVSLGVGSLAVALAAQETVANMIAGFIILVDQPFRVGDHIKLPSGDEGDVYQIGIRSTRILNPENSLIIIPNGDLVKNRITNYAYPQTVVRILVEVNVAYGTDIDYARSILSRLASQHPHILPQPKPEVFLISFGESAIQLRLVGQTSEFAKKFGIETGLREQIYSAFRAEGIHIPYPQRVLHMEQHGPEAAQKK
jgi:MscS family membrane protein